METNLSDPAAATRRDAAAREWAKAYAPDDWRAVRLDWDDIYAAWNAAWAACSADRDATVAQAITEVEEAWSETWDALMSALDRISTIVEGTPKEPFATIHAITGEAMARGNRRRPRP